MNATTIALLANLALDKLADVLRRKGMEQLDEDTKAVFRRDFIEAVPDAVKKAGAAYDAAASGDKPEKKKD